ncbi:MAG TPA: class I SAM-dependent methyltransferase [Mucilaginibacter sp.]|jgi:ubiquinone/menaquinone biosynthesis C-methylase UbiE|nr:class I SAM-dependent methyltransferase [Mucilaginibacter sp.]
MAAENLVSDEIERFYASAAEEKRLTYGLGPLEFERNKELIGRFLPVEASFIIDVGGGPGIYAEWLAGLGHAVHLIDPVAKHIQQAQKRAAKLKKDLKAVLGEARSLDYPDGVADVVIEHGPLYHLQQRADRIKALKEAYRVLKPGGVMLGFAINHSVSTLTGLLNGMIHDELFYTMCLDELKTGLHNPPAAWPGILPEAFFHRPNELLTEVEEVGFADLKLFAVEGMIWLDAKYFESRSNPEKREKMMNLLKATEQSIELLCFSPHMMVCGRKR